jgi:hypothetical protein
MVKLSGIFLQFLMNKISHGNQVNNFGHCRTNTGDLYYLNKIF